VNATKADVTLAAADLWSELSEHDGWAITGPGRRRDCGPAAGIAAAAALAGLAVGKLIS
jgi:hypothetical protein